MFIFLIAQFIVHYHKWRAYPATSIVHLSPIDHRYGFKKHKSPNALCIRTMVYVLNSILFAHTLYEKILRWLAFREETATNTRELKILIFGFRHDLSGANFENLKIAKTFIF
jgi:hypothetical protein